MVDGPVAWPGKPSNYYREVHVLVTDDNVVEDEDKAPAPVVAARLIDQVEAPHRVYTCTVLFTKPVLQVEAPHTGLVVTCLRLGEAKVEVILGNKPSSTNK